MVPPSWARPGRPYSEFCFVMYLWLVPICVVYGFWDTCYVIWWVN
ncbi:hypothetical protein LOK49_LG15G02315 [Camellia lanceoleosa]|uniref:Uncharacterized protein n=1 Tax=Camellia lanceoleosa TaxID=1840588 RepID=A0ACC0F5D6_9ERIC|nr:hypothetical protein LOK49_LG15G02315 [Camellia lanceoleosa]